LSTIKDINRNYDRLAVLYIKLLRKGKYNRPLPDSDLDAPYMVNRDKKWSRREMISEIENRTEIGMDHINGMVSLAIDLLERKGIGFVTVKNRP